MIPHVGNTWLHRYPRRISFSLLLSLSLRADQLRQVPLNEASLTHVDFLSNLPSRSIFALTLRYAFLFSLRSNLGQVFQKTYVGLPITCGINSRMHLSRSSILRSISFTQHPLHLDMCSFCGHCILVDLITLHT